MNKLAILLLILIPLSAYAVSTPVDLPLRSISVARAGTMEDGLANPAALPFRGQGDGSFLLALGYKDDVSPSMITGGEKLSFLNTAQTTLSLSFGGTNAMMTGALGFDLEDRQLDGGQLSYDFLFRMHFQLDVAFNFGPFSAGARLKGGSSLIRSHRQVDDLFELGANMFLSEYSLNPDSEYFQMGLGMMWYDEDYFTLGVYIDNFVGTYGGETTFSWGDMADSLSVGASVYLPRFDRAGDLNLVRPFLTLQFGDVASSASYILASFELRFQLLPRYDVLLTASLLSFRDANVSYMRSTRNLTLFSLEFLLDNWTISASAEIPFSYYTGNSGQDSFALSIGLRYKPS